MSTLGLSLTQSDPSGPLAAVSGKGSRITTASTSGTPAASPGPVESLPRMYSLSTHPSYSPPLGLQHASAVALRSASSGGGGKPAHIAPGGSGERTLRAHRILTPQPSLPPMSRLASVGAGLPAEGTDERGGDESSGWPMQDTEGAHAIPSASPSFRSSLCPAGPDIASHAIPSASPSFRSNLSSASPDIASHAIVSASPSFRASPGGDDAPPGGSLTSHPLLSASASFRGHAYVAMRDAGGLEDQAVEASQGGAGDGKLERVDEGVDGEEEVEGGEEGRWAAALLSEHAGRYQVPFMEVEVEGAKGADSRIRITWERPAGKLGHFTFR